MEMVDFDGKLPMGNNHFQWGNYYFRSTNGILKILMGNYQWETTISNGETTILDLPMAF